MNNCFVILPEAIRPNLLFILLFYHNLISIVNIKIKSTKL